MKFMFISIVAGLCLLACRDSDRSQDDKAETDINAARYFIQYSLKRDYEKARTYMLPDTPNINRMAAIERIHLSPEEAKGLSGASINIHKVNRLNDSTTIISYSNSYMNNHDTLRVKKVEGKWLVDFNYIWDHDQDSTASIKADTLR